MNNEHTPQPPTNPSPPPTQVDFDSLEPTERVAFVLEVRRRITAGEEVSDDEIRDSVRCIRLTRADKARGKKKTKAPERVITLADF